MIRSGHDEIAESAVVRRLRRVEGQRRPAVKMAPDYYYGGAPRRTDGL